MFMDDSVMNLETEAQQAQNEIKAAEPVPAQPEGKPAPEVKPAQPPVQQINPALKYGRRMDYKTAKVSEKPSRFQNRPLSSPNNVRNAAPPSTAPAQNVSTPSSNSGQNVSVPSSNSGQNVSQIPSNGDQNQNTSDEPKSALELELEAIEAAKAASQPIHNPLPTPKKRVPKEMEFDIEPSEYEMHFDLVELNGRDYFDIN